MNYFWRIGSSCLIAVGVVAFYWRGSTSPPNNVVTSSLNVRRETFNSNDNAPATIKVARVTHSDNLAPRSSSSDFKSEFSRSNNYWQFAHRVLPAAVGGSSDAQFYISRALEYCDEHNTLYFTRKGKALGLDEALQYAAQRRLPIDIAQSVYIRCHEFMDHDPSDLGHATDWLAQAAAAGQPVAQAVAASKIATSQMSQNFATATNISNPSTDESINITEDPRALLRAAVQSKDPEVLFSIGDTQSLLDPTNADKDVNRFAWWLIACERGLDCSGTAEWVENSCGGNAGCASFASPSDLVRLLSGDRWPEVQQRAQDLSAKLDQGNWSALGLGS